MLIALTVAIIEEYTEYEDDFPFCSDMEREAKLEQKVLLFNL
jgi:hypothetical protein